MMNIMIDLEIIIIYNNLKKIFFIKMAKKFLLTKKQIQQYKRFVSSFFSILIIITIIDINYNTNCFEWLHITLVILFPPYSILYFILKFFKLLNKPKK